MKDGMVNTTVEGVTLKVGSPEGLKLSANPPSKPLAHGGPAPTPVAVSVGGGTKGQGAAVKHGPQTRTKGV